jgi:formylglycine-generating enzyme required for sulfatase activity
MNRPSLLLTPLLCAICLAWPAAAQAQAAPAAAGAAQSSEHRVALIVGNASYRTSPLKNPVNDARAMRAKLKSMGFEVVYFENLQTRQVGAALREFRNLIRPGSVALFFYAGHGLQVRGENYLPTVDAELGSEEDVPLQSLSLSLVLNTMEDSKAGVNLVLLDACRNNPYARNFRSAPQGLARVQAPSGTLIHYATRPGSVAEDGKGTHGTYTEALLAQIDEKGVPIETALKRVTIKVRESTKGKQEPWMEGSLTGDFYFIQNAQITVQPAPTTADAAAWQAADSVGSVAAYQAYLTEYPGGLYAAAARIKLAGLAAPAAPAAAVPAAAAAPSLLSPVPAGTKDPEAFVWRDVQARGGREHYEAYLRQYPRGRFVAAARNALKGLDQRDAAAQTARPAATNEPQVWENALQTRSEAGYQAYLQAFPSGRYAGQATAALQALRQAAAEPARPAQVVERQLPSAEREALRTAALREMSLARLSGAEYLMGAEAEEAGEDGQPDATAQPQHPVRVNNFELTYYEVTVAQFRKFVESSGYVTEAENEAQPGCQVPGKGGQWTLQPTANWRAPGYPQTDSHPVVCVSFNDVQAYLQWLNGQGDKAERYRLPSEAEWEFAARAGTTSTRPWSEQGGFFSRMWERAKPGSEQPPSRACKNANVADESLRGQLDWPAVLNCSDGYAFTVPGAYFGRNNFGLYDMLGNAAEWTQDCWNANHSSAPRDARVRMDGDCTRHVVRGGSWASPPASIRSAARASQPHAYRAADLGFRIARTPRE